MVVKVLADDVTIRAAAAVLYQAALACSDERVPVLDDAWDAAGDMHSEGDLGNAADCCEEFLRVLANIT